MVALKVRTDGSEALGIITMLIWNNLINYTIEVGMIIEECNLTFDPDMLVNINSYREYHPKEHFSTLARRLPM